MGRRFSDLIRTEEAATRGGHAIAPDTVDDVPHGAELPISSTHELPHFNAGDPTSGLTPEEAADDVYPLHYAAAMGDKKMLISLLDGGDGSGGEDETRQKPLTTPQSPHALDQFRRTALVYAVVGGKLSCAELLLKRGTRVDAADEDGRTALHWACFHGMARMVKLLLANGADPALRDAEGRTVLHLCTTNETTKCYQLVVRALGDAIEPDAVDQWGMTALHWAAHEGTSDHARQLLHRQGARMMLLDHEGKTPLHWAATKGSGPAVKALVDYWRSPYLRNPSDRDVAVDIINLQDHEGRSPLHLAIVAEDSRAVHQLLDLDSCNCGLVDVVGRTPMHWAAQAGVPEVLARLLQRHGGVDQCHMRDDSGVTPLFYAVLSGNVDCAGMILGQGVRDTPDSTGRTGLIMAATMGDAAMCSVLLNVRASADENSPHAHVQLSDPDAVDETGNGALQIAAYHGHIRTVEALLEGGASPNGPNYDESDTSDTGGGGSPIFYACDMGHANIVAVLVAAGARTDFTDEEGRTLLHWAAVAGHSNVCTLLVRRCGLQVDVVDTGGRTPLQNAAFAGMAEAVAALVQAGADADRQDDMGVCALHWAASKGATGVCRVLIEMARVFPNHTEYHEERFTPLDYAIMAGNDALAMYLRQCGSLTIEEVRTQAASHISSWWKGYRARVSLLSLWQDHMAAQQQRIEPSGAAGNDAAAAATAEATAMRTAGGSRGPTKTSNGVSKGSGARAKKRSTGTNRSDGGRGRDQGRGRGKGQGRGRGQGRSQNSGVNGTRSSRTAASSRSGTQSKSKTGNSRLGADSDSGGKGSRSTSQTQRSGRQQTQRQQNQQRQQNKQKQRASRGQSKQQNPPDQIGAATNAAGEHSRSSSRVIVAQQEKSKGQQQRLQQQPRSRRPSTLGHTPKPSTFSSNTKSATSSDTLNNLDTNSSADRSVLRPTRPRQPSATEEAERAREARMAKVQKLLDDQKARMEQMRKRRRAKAAQAAKEAAEPGDEPGDSEGNGKRSGSKKNMSGISSNNNTVALPPLVPPGKSTLDASGAIRAPPSRSISRPRPPPWKPPQPAVVKTEKTAAVNTERSRLRDIRRIIEAAATIQRAWRLFAARQTSLRARGLLREPHGRPANGRGGRGRGKAGNNKQSLSRHTGISGGRVGGGSGSGSSKRTTTSSNVSRTKKTAHRTLSTSTKMANGGPGRGRAHGGATKITLSPTKQSVDRLSQPRARQQRQKYEALPGRRWGQQQTKSPIKQQQQQQQQQQQLIPRQRSLRQQPHNQQSQRQRQLQRQQTVTRHPMRKRELPSLPPRVAKPRTMGQQQAQVGRKAKATKQLPSLHQQQQQRQMKRPTNQPIARIEPLPEPKPMPLTRAQLEAKRMLNRKRITQAYGGAPASVKLWRPRPAGHRRMESPAHASPPPPVPPSLPAATSFDLAVGSYTAPLVMTQHKRAVIGQKILVRKTQQAARRANDTESKLNALRAMGPAGTS